MPNFSLAPWKWIHGFSPTGGCSYTNTLLIRLPCEILAFSVAPRLVLIPPHREKIDFRAIINKAPNVPTIGRVSYFYDLGSEDIPWDNEGGRVEIHGEVCAA